ncbi:MAG: four helix bundle protein [Vicinamibacterales bacterium]
MAVRNYRDLLAWQKSVDLIEAVYLASRELPVEERYGLASQMRRAAISISANIAEGQGRRTCGEFRNHLSMAHGSIRELETHVIVARRLGLFSDALSEGILQKAAEVGRLVMGLLNSLQR